MSGNAATVQVTFPKDGFYLFHDGQNLGPFTLEEVMKKYDGGAVLRTTPLWFPGLANWVTVADLPELDRRGPVATEITLPEKARFDDIIVQLKGHAMTLKPLSVKALVTNEDLRRTDMVYDENNKNWIRSDQHPVVRGFFSMPASPNPLPAAATEIKPATSEPFRAVVQPRAQVQPQATVKAKGKATAEPKAGSIAKIVWILFVVIALALLMFAAWTFFPVFKQMQSMMRSPATVQSATFMAHTLEEFGITKPSSQDTNPSDK